MTAPQATTTMSAANPVVVPSVSSATTRVTVRPVGSVSSRRTSALVIIVTLSCSRAGSTQITWASDLAPSRQGKPSTRSQRMQALVRVARPSSSWVRFTPMGRWKGCSPCFSRSSLSCWMRGSCSTGVWVRAAGQALGGVFAVPSVHEIELLGLGVVRLQVLVADRPGGGDAVVVAQLAEVLGAQSEERGAVELGVAADVVVDLRRELVAVLVVPELGSTVLALDEHRGGVPVVPLARQVAPALQDQDPLPGGSQSMRERAAPAPVPMMMTS